MMLNNNFSQDYPQGREQGQAQDLNHTFNLYELLPADLSDAEAARLADIFMDLALGIESHYYPQIRRHIKALSAAAEEPLE
jgi:hypothetical protein